MARPKREPELPSQGGGSQLSLPGKVTRTSLQLPQGLLFEEYQRVGKALHEVTECTMWWIGDWLLYGPGAYGEMYEEAVTATGFAYQTLANAKMVAKRFQDFSSREERLTWKHHEAVAVLDDDAAARRLLDLAAAGEDGKRWPVAKLRAVVKVIRQGGTLEEALEVSDEAGDDDEGVSRGSLPATLSATLGGTLHDMRRLLLVHEPEEVAANVQPISRARVRGEVDEAVGWLDRLHDALEEDNAKAA